MQTPHVFLASEPGGGLRCALVYLASEHDAYGWFIGRRQDGTCASAYFLLEDLFANAPTRYEAVPDASLHAHWGLDEARRHELARVQQLFADAWLAFGEGRVGVRPEQLDKLSATEPVRTFYTPNFERPVLKHLSRHWPLEYRLHMERTAAAQKRRHAQRARP